MSEWPKQLAPASGPMRQDKVEGALEGMGTYGDATRALAAKGYLQPDMMTGLTLFILGNQPRGDKTQKIPGAGGGVAGGVWVRERFTIHRPLMADETFAVTGESVGKHVHKSRRYSTSRCTTLNAQGELAAENLTTGLLQYKVVEGLEDSLEGEAPDTIDSPAPGYSSAVNNPCLGALRNLQAGDVLRGPEVVVGLDLMQARDTKKPDNPIHSDPEIAKEAGLSRPIAGGSHVLSFALELLMRELGGEVLLHGTSIDVRFRAPVYADLTVSPSAKVASVSDKEVVFNADVTIIDGPVASVATITIPLP